MKWPFIFGFIILVNSVLGNTIRLETEHIEIGEGLTINLTQSEFVYAMDSINSDSAIVDLAAKKKVLVRKKIIAVSLAVTLGVFGVHRLYLGTEPKVPIIYTLTLGGGFGVLVVSDIIAILSAKDLTPYSPNKKVFMWAK